MGEPCRGCYVVFFLYIMYVQILNFSKFLAHDNDFPAF